MLCWLEQVQLSRTQSSEYVIRTQPTNSCLSTLECAALTLSMLEQKEYIKEVTIAMLFSTLVLYIIVRYLFDLSSSLFSHDVQVLLRPLKALCSFQLEHGAQVHHSKEHLLRNGLYDKPMPKNKRKIKRMEKLVTEQNV